MVFLIHTELRCTVNHTSDSLPFCCSSSRLTCTLFGMSRPGGQSFDFQGVDVKNCCKEIRQHWGWSHRIRTDWWLQPATSQHTDSPSSRCTEFIGTCKGNGTLLPVTVRRQSATAVVKLLSTTFGAYFASPKHWILNEVVFSATLMLAG